MVSWKHLLAVSLVALLVAHATTSVDAQMNPCNSIKTPTQCNAMSNCTWCLCKALPSSCFSLAQAKKLPPGVFKCNKTTTQDDGEGLPVVEPVRSLRG